jgi:hypothetical protein
MISMMDLPRDHAADVRELPNAIGSAAGERELTDVALQYDEMAEQVGLSR